MERIIDRSFNDSPMEHGTDLETIDRIIASVENTTHVFDETFGINNASDFPTTTNTIPTAANVNNFPTAINTIPTTANVNTIPTTANVNNFPTATNTNDFTIATSTDNLNSRRNKEEKEKTPTGNLNIKPKIKVYEKTCCLGNNVITTLVNLNFEEFLSNNVHYLKMIKNYMVPGSKELLFMYTIKNKYNDVTARKIFEELQKIKIQFLVVEGYKKHFLYTSTILNWDFKYIVLTSQSSLVTISTMANLTLNHVNENKLPIYFNLSKNIESKFVREYLKLAKTEFQYSLLKNRLIFLVNHEKTCK